MDIGVVEKVSTIDGSLNQLYGFAEQNSLIFFDMYGLRNQGNGTRSNGIRSIAGRNRSCIDRCFHGAMTSIVAEGILGLTPVSRALYLGAKAGAMSAFAGYNAFDTSACVARCIDNGCKN